MDDMLETASVFSETKTKTPFGVLPLRSSCLSATIIAQLYQQTLCMHRTATLVEVLGSARLRPMIPTTPPSSSPSSLGRPTHVDTTVYQSSRRHQGLSPEFGVLQDSSSSTAPSNQEIASASSPVYVTVQNQRVPEPFHGDAYEDADD
ncbi:hypothetical protein HPB50_019450 [Hyalomma asiaticum]|uniref:Uncharacterized protein n=1 Tax=Hyalomma asiaticum TaxID=266040 RepID=A0ACB7T8P2_HYAAI|nr:hypothetical protein HPB50_019450 [Hyalomma asiaticum]